MRDFFERLGQAIHRRDALKLAAAAVGASAVALSPSSVLANVDTSRAVSLYNTHTGEGRQIEYYGNGRYYKDGLAELNTLLRDHRTNQSFQMNTHLMDLAFLMQQLMHAKSPIHVISGFRSPKTNAMLRGRSGGVARNSFHMRGMAMDIRVPGFDTRAVHYLAKRLQVGGVGYYPDSNFVHMDVGPVRYW